METDSLGSVGGPLEKAEQHLLPERTGVCESHTDPLVPSQETRQLISGKERAFAAEREQNESRRAVSEHRGKSVPSRAGVTRTYLRGPFKRMNEAGLKQTPLVCKLNLYKISSAHKTFSVPFFLKYEMLQKYL